MEADQIEDIFGQIDEQSMPVGILLSDDDGNAVVPFLCNDHRFFALYEPVVVSDYRNWVETTVSKDASYTVSPNAHLMKFSSAEMYIGGGDIYAPPTSLTLKERNAIRYRMPERLQLATKYFLDETPLADELYFQAAAPDCDGKRFHKLNKWYKLISNRIAVTGLKMQAIHPVEEECYWYGYRKAHPERTSAG
jgi:hypothetical protein